MRVDDRSDFEMFDRLSYPVLIIDNEQMPLWGNKKFLSLHGLDAVSLKDGVSTSSMQTALKLALAGGEYVVEKGHRKHYYQAVKSNISLQKQKVIQISLFDISKRKRLQAEVLSRQEMFEQLSENLPDGVVLFEEHIVYSNPAFERLVGHTGNELKTKRVEELIVPPEEVVYLQNIQRLRSFEVSKTEAVVRVLTKKGQRVLVRIKSALVSQKNGKRLLNIVTDITYERTQMQRLERLATFDALTDIYNRRKFDELLRLEYKRAIRYEHRLSAIFFDIDHFKKINDAYGHDVGDAVLKQLTDLIRVHLRETDIFSRWGGEEFIVLLLETDKEHASDIAEKLRSIVADASFPKVGHVTVSLGVSGLKGKERIESFMKRLDKALYQAKVEGRDRKVVL